MADITITTTYTAGSTLDPDDHNQNIYSETGDEGLMSEPNGGLDNANLASGFEVLREHIQPEEIIRMRQNYGLETLDYVDYAFPSLSENVFSPIANCGVRFHMPFTPDAVLYQWSVFIHPFRFLVDNNAGGSNAQPDMLIRARLGGSALSHTVRQLPISIIYDVIGTTDTARLREDRCCYWYDMCHLDTSPSAGFTSLVLTMYMEMSSQTIAALEYTPPGQALTNTSFEARSRATIGVRNAKAIAFY